ncbi:MAG: hypothetical protein J6K32_13080 [Clostridia bacterium]|nr:hypothetical protein [Clostridia bacterium]
MPTARQPSTLRKRIHSIIEVGAPDDYVSRAYDFINMLSILVNLVCSVAYTFAAARERYGPLLLTIESVTVAFFAIDYLLRLVTALLHKAAVSMHHSPASGGVLFSSCQTGRTPGRSQ